MELLDESPKPQVGFPIVGIGASAGGLEAVTNMFSKIEPDLGLAYVLVMHLDPNHESLMVELLSRKTSVKVVQIEDGDEIQPDQLHVIPPGFALSMDGKVLKLDRFDEPRGLRRPIDNFFGSLAKNQGEKCACVVLSGTGADGTAGLRAGKDLGGVVAVQVPEEAKYDGMPYSAISTNLIDFTLPADEIIPRLHSYFSGADEADWSLFDRHSEGRELELAESTLSRVFRLVQEASGNDFSGYKTSMLMRRLKRRMQVKQQRELVSYLSLLRDDKEEQLALAQDFLINVTSFFRDWEKFELVRKQVLVPLVSNASTSDELRIWVPGCSSGQEAYSIAMMVDRTCEELNARPLIQIFATDIDADMLARARTGEYLISELFDLPSSYQEAYTSVLDGKFEVTAKIKEMVRFSHHNLLQDPPFSRIDLISCRNLLIYLNEELQTQLFPVLHFSLRPGGYLYLGSSESTSRQDELFTTVDLTAKIYKRLETSRRRPLNIPLSKVSSSQSPRTAAQRLSEDLDFPDFPSLSASNDEIYQEYAPPFVRVTKGGRVIGSSGDLGLFLLSRPGEERELSSLLRDGIRETTLSLLSDAAASGLRKAIEGIDVHASFGTLKADIVAHPMRDGTVSILFVVQGQLKPIVERYRVAPVSPDKRVTDLQNRLAETQEVLKRKVEEVETANEELKSSNEEMMSMYEELQSASEELTTANEELKNKVDELTLAKADLDNFLTSAGVAMIVLDRSLRIRHVTDAVMDLLPIQKSDNGRFLTEFNLSWGPDDLARSIRAVMDTRVPYLETTNADREGLSLFVRIEPYYFKDGSVEGATLTLTDISQEVALRDELARETQRLMLAMRAGNMGLAEFDFESQLVTIDQTLARQLGFNEAGVHGLGEFKQKVVEDDLSVLDQHLSASLKDGEEYEFVFRVRRSDGNFRWLRTRGTRYTSKDGRQKLIGPTLDITEATNFHERRELLVREMSHRIKNLFAVISSLVHIAPRGYQDTKSMASELVEKISALGRVYDLARKKTTADGVELKELIRSVLEPHVLTQSVELSGPSMQVTGDTLNTFTLAIHELVTNAYKYGALSVDGGELKINWESGDDGLTTFNWSENMPDFKVPECNDGFGSELLHGTTGQLEGSFRRDYSENGADIEFSVRLGDAQH